MPRSTEWERVSVSGRTGKVDGVAQHELVGYLLEQYGYRDPAEIATLHDDRGLPPRDVLRQRPRLRRRALHVGVVGVVLRHAEQRREVDDVQEGAA